MVKSDDEPKDEKKVYELLRAPFFMQAYFNLFDSMISSIKP